ncbi:MAG TPA: hypothetical protein VGG90_10410 [Candidatus Dormibacteraeota bacterium]
MQLAHYLHGLRRFWPVVAAGAVIGLIFAYGFLKLTMLDQASADVAILDPMSGRSTNYNEAQVTFDSIIKSETLAEKVSLVVNEDPATVRNDLSVTVATNLNPNNPSPLYVVHGRDHGVSRAILLVNTAIGEGRKLYVSLNAANTAAYQATIDVEAKAASDNLTAAQAALDDFASSNNAVDLPGRLATMTALADAGSSSAATERDRLEKLQSQYAGLAFAVQAAQARAQTVATEGESLKMAELLPTSAETKVLDPAAEEGQALYVALVYALGLVTGAAVGLAVVYGLMFTGRRPATPAEVAAALGAPVLVRIPKAAQ